MRVRIKPWLALLLIAASVALVTYLVRTRRARFVLSDAELVALLPHRDSLTVFLSVDVLRSAGLLSLLQASRPGQEPDYRSFVQATGFDYTRDVQAIAARGNEQQIFLLIRGRFDWSRLRDYAAHHGGACNGAFCQVPAIRSGRWASYLSVQPDVIGLALGHDPADVLLLSPRKIDHAAPIPSAPVWVNLPASMLADPKELPVPVRLFALALQSAENVTLSAKAGQRGASDFEVDLLARCQNAAIADTAKTQLEMDTRLLAMELHREHQQPSRADLTGLLTAGTFRQTGNTVAGRWPLYREFLKRLQ